MVKKCYLFCFNGYSALVFVLVDHLREFSVLAKYAMSSCKY